MSSIKEIPLDDWHEGEQILWGLTAISDLLMYYGAHENSCHPNVYSLNSRTIEHIGLLINTKLENLNALLYPDIEEEAQS